MSIKVERLSDTVWAVMNGNTLLAEIDGDTINLRGTVKMGTSLVSPSADELAALNGISNIVQGVAASYKVARGVSAITGSGTVVTGLTSVVAVVASAASDLDGDTLAGVSATIGDQAGSPAAGSVYLKAWKSNGDGDATVVAADAAKNIAWIAIGL